MPWCGPWGIAGTAYGWVPPLIGLVVVGVMIFACFGRFRCMGGRRHMFADDAGLRREVENLKDVRKQQRNPS